MEDPEPGAQRRGARYCSPVIKQLAAPRDSAGKAEFHFA